MLDIGLLLFLFSRRRCYASFHLSHQCIVWLAAERIQKAGNSSRPHSRESRASDAAAIVTAGYSHGLEMGWPSVVHRMFVGALEAVPCGRRRGFVYWRGSRYFVSQLWVACVSEQTRKHTHVQAVLCFTTRLQELSDTPPPYLLSLPYLSQAFRSTHDVPV